MKQLDGTDSSDTAAELGFRALLGFRAPGSEHYDVYISYKHGDKDIAESMFHFLQGNMLNPFMDSISLPVLADSDYTDSIMNALDCSDNFVVILSTLKCLESSWIKWEMSAYMNEIQEGNRKLTLSW